MYRHLAWADCRVEELDEEEREEEGEDDCADATAEETFPSLVGRD